MRGAVAINVITMIGIGPLITIPLVLAQLAGPLALAGWIAGALVALCDGLVWAELGSLYPGSGGTYVFLREIFGPRRWGRMLAFLFNWQFLLYAPFLLASGYIGFADYLGYLIPAVARSAVAHDAAAVAVGAFTIVLLYRRITAVAAIGSALALAAVLTLLLVIAASAWHANLHQAFAVHGGVALGTGFLAGLGGALFITLYDYVGYSDAALLGEEVRAPRRTIPLAIVISILVVAALYLALQIGVLSAIPWQTLVTKSGPTPNSQFVASSVVQLGWGTAAARIVTALILVTAFASLFGNLAGFARIPYAAARDGEFFAPFAKLHPRGQFPHVSLLIIGIASLAAAFFDLSQAIAILTAGIVLIQSVLQIVGLFVVRARRQRAPFRMWLFPVPALIALAGWLYAFASTGTLAIALGAGWLMIGGAVYLLVARRQQAWPFALAALLLCLPMHARAAQAWPGGSIVVSRGYPIYTVDGKPFFIYGAAFFYERIPRTQWEPALRAYRALGINTIDLYLIWNWHELSDGVFDFSGRTNSRRDLVTLFRLLDREHFKVIVRPGPVIRNEWRNGGYPSWLLVRREYRMPLRDVLEGRYPPTATLQNKHSDDAAAEWMRNATHMRYAARWLRTVLSAVAPWRRDVIAIALDDDQGAYMDNQTWPSPHFHRYISYLESVVRSVIGSRVPLFINTYQMKVTAAAPAWAWGNWYQSDAYSIGEHDRAQLEFSTGLLQTQRLLPVMSSEFQAGWLQGADEAVPRPADPANTTLALHTLLDMGARGVVNFPVQDTLYPAGWEVPWANAFYSWDAALSVQLTPQRRWRSTRSFGELVNRWGTLLARTHVAADAAIAYATSAYDPSALSNAQIGSIAQATLLAQRGCRIVRLTCAVVDLRYATLPELLRYPALVLPDAGIPHRFGASIAAKLTAYRQAGHSIVSSPRGLRVVSPAAGRVPGATLFVSDDERFAFLDVVNYGGREMRVGPATLRAGRFAARLNPAGVARRSALLVPFVPAALIPQTASLPALASSLGAGTTPLPLRAASFIAAHLRSAPRRGAIAYRSDVYQDGYSSVIMENARLRLIVSPCAGTRALIFEDKARGDNLFTTIGGLRDAWSDPLPPSPRDYIAPFTHPIAAGTFNRCYASAVRSNGARAQAWFSYFAPDAPPKGAFFTRTLTLNSDSTLHLATRASFTASLRRRAELLTSFALKHSARVLRVANGYGFYEPDEHRIVMTVWRKGDVLQRRLERHAHDALMTLTLAAGNDRLAFRVADAAGASQAQAALSAFANRP